MAITVTHTKVSAKNDGGDATLVRPSDWNAGHVLAGVGTLAEQNANAVAITGGTISGITDLAILDGGTGASTAADARTNLGLDSMALQAASAVAITGGSISGITDLALLDGGTGASTAADARANLGCGTIATQNSNSVSISGGTITGITDLAVADGGTGAGDAAGARTNLGLVIGTNVAPATSGTAIQMGNGTGGFSSAVAGTDYPGLASANTFSGTNTYTATQVVQQIIEKVTLEGTQIGSGSTLPYDCLTQGVLFKNYATGPAGNWTLNIRGDAGQSLNTMLATDGKSITFTLLVRQGTTGYLPTVIQVDGTTVGVTTIYSGGTAWTADASCTSAFSFTVIRTATATFTVLASKTKYA